MLTRTAILVWLGGGFVSRLFAGEPSALNLHPGAQVNAEGIYLSDVAHAAAPLPAVRLATAPAFGQTVTLTRAQIQELLVKLAPECATTNWQGAPQVRVTRRAIALAEDTLKELLTTTLQRDYVKDLGELELRFTRPWTAINVPDEPLSLKILNLPASGVGPMFIVRFELAAGTEILGTWQACLEAKVWKEIWVAQSPLRRGELFGEADLVRERRDMLTIHDALANVARDDSTCEFSQSVPAGAPILARVLRPRALVHRGQHADAVVRDGTLEVTMKVVVLEDGVPGQIVRARNPVSQREIRGKVLDEQTLLVML